MTASFIHPTAEVAAEAEIGPGTRIWNDVQVRERARIGADCTLGKGVYVDADVVIGSRVKIENNVSVYRGVLIEDGVFVGPHVCFTNDRVPRAITPDGVPKGADDWEVTPTLVRYGASIGAGAILLPGIIIGRFALVGAGAVVTRSVADHQLVYGNPARHQGYVGVCGHTLTHVTETPTKVAGRCAQCGQHYIIPIGQSSL